MFGHVEGSAYKISAGVCAVCYFSRANHDLYHCPLVLAHILSGVCCNGRGHGAAAASSQSRLRVAEGSEESFIKMLL